MELTYKNINPCKLYDELAKNNILPKLITSDIKENELIAENVWIILDGDIDIDNVNSIIKNLDNNVVAQPTTEELLLKEIANLKIEIMQLKGGNV